MSARDLLRNNMKTSENETKQKMNRPGKSSVRIYRELRQKILQNELLANQPLRQDKIASQFGVSKIPVREALRQLEADGLVEFKPRRGAFVVELSEHDILENLEIRIALECRAIELAIPNMTDEDLSLAEEILHEYQQVNDIERWSELNTLFHRCIYSPCGMTKLLAMIQDIKDRTKSFMRLKITQVSGLERPHAEHLAILQACKDNQPEIGARLLKEHIECTKKEVVAYFRRENLAQLQL